MAEPIENAQNVIMGDCNGEEGNFTYTIQDGTLSFEGSGKLTNDFDLYCFDDDSTAIERYYALLETKKIVIGEGCTAIGDEMFDANNGWTGNDHYNWIQLDDPYEAEVICIP